MKSKVKAQTETAKQKDKNNMSAGKNTAEAKTMVKIHNH